MMPEIRIISTNPSHFAIVLSIVYMNTEVLTKQFRKSSEKKDDNLPGA